MFFYFFQQLLLLCKYIYYFFKTFARKKLCENFFYKFLPSCISSRLSLRLGIENIIKFDFL